MDSDEFYFDEEIDLDAEPTPEEIEKEIAELAEMDARDMARLALMEEQASRRKDILGKYRQDWVEEYGVDPTKPELWKIGREREIRKRYGGPEKLLETRRAEFLAQQKEKRPERAVKTIQRGLRQEMLCKPCENLNASQQAKIDPLKLIRLKVDGHCVCYDVVDLYENLSQKHGNDTQARWHWRDPTYNIIFSPAQSKRIKNSWAKVRPQGQAKYRLATDIALSKMSKIGKK